MSGVNAGALDREITLQQLTDGVAASRFPKETWTTLDTVWASRRDMSGAERFRANQLSAATQSIWKIQYRDDMDPESVGRSEAATDCVPRTHLRHRRRASARCRGRDRADDFGVVEGGLTMTVEQAVADHLAADSGVSALVAGRIYLLRLPQDPTYPAIRVQLISEPESSHLRGRLGQRPARVQVDAFDEESSGGDPYAGVDAITAAMDTALLGRAPITIDGLELRVTRKDDRQSLYDPDELRVVRMMNEYLVWVKQAA
jgi:hypothetical protein